MLERPLLVGVIHLAPLPGAPNFGGSMQAVIDGACRDAIAYTEGGMGAVIVENFGDVPFTAGRVAAETCAAMAVAGQAVGDVIGDLPLGFNVLRNDAETALGLCAAIRGCFIRVNVHTGAMLTDQGLIEGGAHRTLRDRNRLCPGVRILADVHVKHATPVAGEVLEDAARDCLRRGLADALVVSGSGTGESTPTDTLRRVRAACPEAFLLVGSGATAESARDLLELADGIIAGTALKREGRVANPVDPLRVETFARSILS